MPKHICRCTFLLEHIETNSFLVGTGRNPLEQITFSRYMGLFRRVFRKASGFVIGFGIGCEKTYLGDFFIGTN